MRSASKMDMVWKLPMCERKKYIGSLEHAQIPNEQTLTGWASTCLVQLAVNDSVL